MKTLLTSTFCLSLILSLLLPAANIYWGPGATGTWFTPNGWREGSVTGALRDAPLDTDNAYIESGWITISSGVSATNATLYVGDAAGSTGTLAIDPGGAYWTTGNAYIGRSSGGSRGHAIVGGHMRIGTYLITGYSGTGNLDITSSGTVQTLQYLNFGHAAAGRGFANVEGTVQVGSYMLLGRLGQGTMDVASGGVVSISTYLDIGQSAGSAGHLNLAGSLSAGGYIYVGGSGTGTLTLRDGGFVRVGTGTITIAQAATATGLLEITGTSAGAITRTDGTTPAAITGGAGSARVLFSHSNANYTFANTLDGSLAVEVNGSGLTTLTGDNNYIGGTIVRSGTLAGSTASIRGDAILVDGALLLDTPAAHSLTLTGSGLFEKLGEGTLTLTPDSSFTGALVASAGTLAFGAPSFPADTPVTISCNLSIAPAAAIEIDTGAATLIWSGSFATTTSAGTLLKTGVGSLAFATPNLAFAGTFAVNQGSATLAPGTILGALSVGASASFSGGGSTVTGTLSLAHDSMLSFDLATPATTTLNVGGLLASGTTTIDFINLKNGSYTIITSSDSILADATNFTYTVNGATLSGRNSVDLIFGANDISILATIYNLRVTWVGVTGGIWDASSENWNAADDNRFANGDSVRFDASASGTITIIPAGVTAGDIEVATTGTLTFVGGAIATDADSASFDGIPGIVSLGGGATDTTTGKLVKKGVGSLVLANEAGTFTGGVEIEQGVLSFNNAAQLDTTGTNITFTGDAELRADGNITGATGALSNAISIADANATFNTQGHTVEYTGALSSTGAAALTKTGAGSLILRATDNSAFTAPVSVTAGSLLLADGAQLGSHLTVSVGASAGGDGVLTGNISINNGTLLAGTSLETPAASTLNIGGALTLAGSARVVFGIHAGGLADTLNVAGAIITDTVSNIVGLTFGHIDSGTYALGNATALADIDNLEVKGFLVDSTFRAKYELTVSAGALFFIHEADDSRYMEWTGASGTTQWDIAQDNWSDYSDDTSGYLKFQDTDTVRFSTTTATTTIAIDSAVTVSDMLVSNTGELTFIGQAINTSLTVTGTLVMAPGGKLVKTGEGALVLNNAGNTFIGGVEINAGLLAFSNTAQLGTAGAGIRFTGSGTLRTLAPMTISDTLTLAGMDFVPTLDTGDNDVTLTGALAGTGTLAKLGSGTLMITNSNTPASVGYHITAGTLQTEAAVLKTSRVTIDDGGTLILVQETSVSYTPDIYGPGAFEKRGSGVLTLTGSLGNTGATRILEGELKPGASNYLNPSSALVIGQGATLDMRGTLQVSASLDNNGTLLMSATVNSTAGVIIDSDYLNASQFITGSGVVNVTLTETTDDGYTFIDGPAPSSVVLIESTDNTADFTFNVDDSPADAIFAWDVTKEGDNYVLGQTRLVPLIPAVVGINAALLIGTETTLDALSRQNAAMRLNNAGSLRPGCDWWVNSTYRHDTIKETLYHGSKAITKGVQAGMNYTKASETRGRGRRRTTTASPWVTGVFIDCVNTHISMNDADTTTLSYKGGIHVGYQPNNAFYASALVFASTTRHTIRVDLMPSNLRIGASSVGAAVEMGYMIKTKSGWLVEPQAQISWHSTNVSSVQDSAHRLYEIGNIASYRERVGLQFTRGVKLHDKLILLPSLRMAYNHENRGTNTVSITRYFDADSTRPRDRYYYTDDFGGGSFLLGGGVTMRIKEKFEIQADASTKLGGKLENYTINLGIAWRW